MTQTMPLTVTTVQVQEMERLIAALESMKDALNSVADRVIQALSTPSSD